MPQNPVGLQPDHWVMIRDWYQVPGVPRATLEAVFGHQPVDSHLEQAELIFEYWNSSGAPRDLVAQSTFDALQGRINRNNVAIFISLLAIRGVAADFFDLTRSDVDRNGQLRRFLLVDCGVSLYTIGLYASFNGLNPKLFADGFLVGLGESFAVVVVGLADMAKMLVRINQEFYLTILIAPSDPSVALKRLEGQLDIVSQAFTSVIGFLDPSTVPARVLQVWKDWNKNFADCLQNMDPFGAGHVLGRIAGDLWQLLTGIVALAKLIRAAAGLARKFAPLLMTSVRGAAEEMALWPERLAGLLVTLDKALMEGLPRVGTAVLDTLFPPELLQAISQKGSAFVAWMDWSLCMVTEPAYAAAFNGSKMRSPFAMMASYQGRPLFMAALSETAAVSGIEAPKLFTEAEVVKFLDRAFPEAAQSKNVAKARRIPIKLTDAQKIEVSLARLAQLSQRLESDLNVFIRRIAFEKFAELRRLKIKFSAGRFGSEVHAAAKTKIGNLISSVSPGTKVFADDTLYKFAEAAKSWDPRLEAQLAESSKLLDEKVSSFLYRRPDLLKAMGAQLNSEADAASYVKRFGWKESTRIGDLKPDALLVDTEGVQVSNIDWTSSTKLEQFEKTWNQLFDGLGDLVQDGKFTGEWRDFKKAYRSAFRGGIPKEVQDALKDLQWHAERETVVRQAILGELLGDKWYVRSLEFLYEGLNTLFGQSM
jgi:hypothetical protein